MMLEKERYCHKKGQRKRFSIIEINKIFLKKTELVCFIVIEGRDWWFCKMH